MKKPYIYIYPAKLREDQITLSSNPYIKNLHKALSKEFIVINEKPASRLGQLFDVYKYIFKDIDFIYFNWIERIGGGRFASIQYIIYRVLILIIKLKKTKIIYLLHNKLPRDNNRLSKKIMIDIIKKADFLIAHSEEGLEILKNINDQVPCIFLPHPMELKIQNTSDINKEFDILIWGSIHSYKGVDKFLDVFIKSKLHNRIKIKIAGEISGLDLTKKIESYSNSKIIIENWIHTDDEIEELIQKARIVLFTYLDGSVLSSGALVKTLEIGGVVLGPKIGSFKDLSKFEIVHVYEDFYDLISKIDFLVSKHNIKVGNSNIEKFANSNTWENYGNKIKAVVKNSNTLTNPVQ